MHNAPSVNYPVGRSRLAGWLLMAAWAVGTSAVAAWSWQAPSSTGRTVLAWSAVLLAGAFAAGRWARSPSGALGWDGDAWSWTVGERVFQAEPEVVLDLQHALLLRLGADGPGPWLWLEKHAAPARWDDLRRAVYSRARPEGMPGAQPPGTTR